MVKHKAKILYRRIKKNGITFEAVKDYAERSGYSVLMYDSPEGKIELEAYNLQELAAKRRAFTFDSKVKFIFITSAATEYEKIFLLLHELGHVLLGHTSQTSVKDSFNCEMEADAFAYEVLHHKSGISPKLFSAFLVLIAFLTGALISRGFLFSQKLEPLQKPIQETAVVYVTPSGSKYHTANCQFVSGNANAKKVSLSEVLHTHTPCKVCTPQIDIIKK